jgi:RhtX/FptX family siderophore transporter
VSTAGKLALLATLYFSQGLPFGFFTQALPVLMRKQQASLAQIGLTALLALPWALKFLWAPLVDRYGSAHRGRRRAWIVPLQACAALAMAALAAVDPQRGLWVVMAAVLVTNLLAATQDIATDALAVNLLDHRERGLGNGVQVAGYRVGMIIGGGALLVLFERVGWERTFLAMAAMLALASVPIALHREAPSPAPERQPGGMFLSFLRRPRMGGWLLVLVVYKGGDALASAMIRPLLVDVGLSMEDIGWLLGAAGFAAGLAGALAGGWASGRFGRLQALIACGLFQGVAVAAYLLPSLGVNDTFTLYAVCVLEHFAGGTATASLFTLMMDAARRETAATDYTVQASVVVIATGGAAASSGYVAEALGYASFFTLSGALCFLGVLGIWLYLRRVGVPEAS